MCVREEAGLRVSERGLGCAHAAVTGVEECSVKDPGCARTRSEALRTPRPGCGGVGAGAGAGWTPVWGTGPKPNETEAKKPQVPCH